MRGLMNKLTGGGVDWTLQLEATLAVFRPGDAVRGTVTFTPRYDVDARAVIVSLVGVERYQVVRRSRNSRGKMARRTDTRSHELARQDVQLDGPTRFPTGQAVTRTFQVTIPPGAPPTFQSRVLRCEWKVDARIDAGGRDPSTDQSIMVVQPAAALASLGQPVEPRIDAIEDGICFGVWLEPMPLILGAPFRGVADLATPLDQGARLELRVSISATAGTSGGTGSVMAALGGSGTSGTGETLTIWQGALGAPNPVEGWHRYAFEGVLPAQLVPTIQLPHGHSQASFEIVVPRRLRPDTHYRRDVVLATSP